MQFVADGRLDVSTTFLIRRSSLGRWEWSVSEETKLVEPGSTKLCGACVGRVTQRDHVTITPQHDDGLPARSYRRVSRWEVVVVRQTLRQLGPQARAARVVMATALAWGVSAVVHLGVFVVDGGGWEGPVSWRKPIVFSASFALLLWAVGWVLDRMPVARPRLAGVLAWGLAVTSTIETSLIVLQTWRGRASHFNVFDPADAALFGIMGAMIGLVALGLVVLFAWALVERPTDAATRWAVLGGLAMIVTGLGVGQWLVELGMTYVERFGAVPDVVTNGDAVVKFPHAVALHGIQLFALVLALGAATDLTATRRLRAVRCAVVGYGGLLGVAVATSIAGLPADAIAPWSLIGLSASMATIVVALALPLVARRRPQVTG